MRQAPSPSAFRHIDRTLSDRRARDAIARRLDQLEHDRAQLLTVASACRRAARCLPEGRDREVLVSRADALRRDFETFRTLVTLRDTATA